MGRLCQYTEEAESCQDEDGAVGNGWGEMKVEDRPAERDEKDGRDGRGFIGKRVLLERSWVWGSVPSDFVAVPNDPSLPWPDNYWLLSRRPDDHATLTELGL
jgi:hypothetical protein